MGPAPTVAEEIKVDKPKVMCYKYILCTYCGEVPFLFKSLSDLRKHVEQNELYKGDTIWVVSKHGLRKFNWKYKLIEG